MRTEVNELGRVIVIDEIPNDTPQAYTVCVKDPNDWEEMHDYIINENEIDGIPNRRITCISSMSCSTKRSVYEMSNDEADVLRNHSKVEWVEKSSMHNPVVLEQRKYDEEFDRHSLTNRYKQNIVNRRASGDPTPVDNSLLNFTQWGLLRHQSKTNVFETNTTVDSDIQYSLTGKNVDVVIMDTSVRWDHPEFLNSGVDTFVDKNSTRVRDILIHGASEYGTLDYQSYQEKIFDMNMSDLQAHASRVGIVPIDNRNMLTDRLLREFKKHVLSFRKPKQTSAKKPQDVSQAVKSILAQGR